jgi:putative PIN family toxin of toxin-antitoxin system
VLDAARSGLIELFATTQLLVELEDVLRREKFARRLELVDLTARDLVVGYAALAKLVEPASIDPVILEDPEDDAVLACAAAVDAEAIVSGDSHLLNLKTYQGIPVLPADELLARISA